MVASVSATAVVIACAAIAALPGVTSYGVELGTRLQHGEEPRHDAICGRPHEKFHALRG